MTTSVATNFDQPLDPSDYSDYVSEFGPQLAATETITTFTVSPTTEGAALGLEIGTVLPPSLEVGDKNVLFWVLVNAANQNDPIFDYDGTAIPIEVSVVTTFTRKLQRTFLLTVKQL